MTDAPVDLDDAFEKLHAELFTLKGYALLDALISELRAARAAPPADEVAGLLHQDPQGTFAWLVVQSNPHGKVWDTDRWPPNSALYMCARGWTHDVCKALRYARKEDAQAVSDSLNSLPHMGHSTEVEEHGFAPVDRLENHLKGKR